MKYDEVILLRDILGMEATDIVAHLLKDGPKDCTWTKQADWVEENIPQSVLKAAFLRLYDALEPVSQAEDGTPEDKLAEQLRDDMDILWRAASDESHKELEAAWAEQADGEDVSA